MVKLRDTIDSMDELSGAIILDGYDEAIIGYDITVGRLVYDSDKIIAILSADMGEEDAQEFFDYNIAGGYYGEQSPVLLGHFKQPIGE